MSDEAAIPKPVAAIGTPNGPNIAPPTMAKRLRA
ncbi:unnamed protein product, partial [Rotaria sp. Silwood1]